MFDKNLPKPSKSEPMPDVRVTRHSLEDVQSALTRAMTANTVNQMTDAMVSIDYFYNIAKEHHLAVINNMNEQQQGVYVPDQYKRESQKYVQPSDKDDPPENGDFIIR